MKGGPCHHVRRKFFDIHAANGSSLAKQALDRIGEFYGVEKTITGLPPDQRRAERQKRSKPIAEAMRNWAEATLPKLSRKSELAKAFRYMRSRWKALLRCLDDGRLALDNNPAERALRCVATRRSLCRSSSSLWKHCDLVFDVDATRTAFSRKRGGDARLLQVAGTDLVWGAGHHLLGGKDALFDQAADPVIGDAELTGGLGHR